MDGPPLVLLHGLGRCWEDFESLIPALRSDWHLFALDHRGHGQSEAVTGRYFVTDYVADAVQFLKREIPNRAVLYGHSLGAMVALAVAVEQPNSVAGVILEDPPFHTMGQHIGQTPWQSLFVAFQEIARRKQSVDRAATALAEIRVPTPDGVKTLGQLRSREALQFSARCLSVVDPDIYTPVLEGRWLEGYDERSLFRSLARPVLLLQGDPKSGGALTDDDAATAQAVCSQLRRIKFPDTGHLIHHEQPRAVLAAIAEFKVILFPYRRAGG
jgi:pimeloyl-ACP methyl ester carboxylesterase